MKTALMVAEKPSLAQSLAKILSRNNLNSRKGFNGACTIHEFVTIFPPTGENMKFKFTSVCGHVMGLDFTSKYNNWDKIDPVGKGFMLHSLVINNIKKYFLKNCNFKNHQ